MPQVFSVPDMSCDHCKMRIEKQLGSRDEVRSVEVDLEGKKVTVDGDLSSEAIVELIDEAGYDATPLE